MAVFVSFRQMTDSATMAVLTAVGRLQEVFRTRVCVSICLGVKCCVVLVFCWEVLARGMLTSVLQSDISPGVQEMAVSGVVP